MPGATATASSTDRAIPLAGCVTPSPRASAWKRSRSSATSMESGGGARVGGAAPPRAFLGPSGGWRAPGPPGERLEALPVLGDVEGVGRRAEDGDARRLERFREPERRLAAELH